MKKKMPPPLPLKKKNDALQINNSEWISSSRAAFGNTFVTSNIDIDIHLFLET